MIFHHEGLAPLIMKWKPPPHARSLPQTTAELGVLLDITLPSIAVIRASFNVIRLLFDHGGTIRHGQLSVFFRCQETTWLENEGLPLRKNRTDSARNDSFRNSSSPLLYSHL